VFCFFSMTPSLDAMADSTPAIIVIKAPLRKRYGKKKATSPVLRKVFVELAGEKHELASRAHKHVIDMFPGSMPDVLKSDTSLAVPVFVIRLRHLFQKIPDS